MFRIYLGSLTVVAPLHKKERIKVASCFFLEMQVGHQIAAFFLCHESIRLRLRNSDTRTFCLFQQVFFARGLGGRCRPSQIHSASENTCSLCTVYLCMYCSSALQHVSILMREISCTVFNIRGLAVILGTVLSQDEYIYINTKLMLLQ
jgi:hypothetical protein